MNFDSLASVGSSITVRNRREDADNDYKYSLDVGETPPLDIEFPSLVNCSRLEIMGNISRSVPSSHLSTVSTIGIANVAAELQCRSSRP